MRINGVGLRTMYQDMTRADNGNPRRFVSQFCHLIGLCDQNGVYHYNDQLGRNVLESQALRPESFATDEMARAIIGENAAEIYGRPADQVRNVLEAGAGGTDIVPSAFANISAYNSAVAGLLEVRILESYSRPEFIFEKLAETVPTRLRSIKHIGIGMIGDTATERKPGERHPRVDLPERYVTTPDTKNRANAIDVTREAALFDLTRELLAQAETVGETHALRREYRTLQLVMGVNNSYTYNGTSYNTYVASAGNWVNILGSNGIADASFDWTFVNKALILFSKMTDQEVGQPINVNPKDILVVSPAGFMSAWHVLHQTSMQFRTQSQAFVADGPLPLPGLNIVNSAAYPYARRIAVASASASDEPGDPKGLGLSDANADGLWYTGDFKKAFGYNQNLPLTTVRANASDYEMGDRGLVFSLFTDEMGIEYIKDPRYVVKCKVEA